MVRRLFDRAMRRGSPMGRLFGILSLVGILSVGAGLAAGPAAADPDRGGVRPAHAGGGGHGYGHGYGYGGRGHGYGYRHGYGHGYGYGHDYGYGYGHGYGHRRHHRRHRVGRTLLGIGVGLLMYDLYDRARRRGAGGHGDDAPVYGGGAAPRVIVVREPVGVAPPPPSYERGTGAGRCLQTREYQTVVRVGGREREAYGTACLMPDGSWRMGAPRLVPEE